MNASMLRAVLAVALLLGLGVVHNILTNQADRAEGRLAGNEAGTSRALSPARMQLENDRQRVLIAVRRELQSRGYLKTISAESLDIPSQSAILAFEFDNKLPLTAVPSERLLKQLIFTPAGMERERPFVPQTKEAIALIDEVQRALAHLGYGDTQTTSQLDRKTQRAIRKFERARGLQVSGRISAPLIESLGPAFDRTRLGSATAHAPNADAG
jgi:peptidoglycan hydrolase-like protein with peptidoglycan-binding domain